MNTRRLVARFSFLLVLFSAALASAHCEIPCGIYDDAARLRDLSEHIDTMEKSMRQIVGIGTPSARDINQQVRWITNKDLHATLFQDIVSRYFLTQRIKPATDNYGEKLANLHQMLVYAMKCKQTTDLANIEKLRLLLKTFESLYMKPAKDL